MELLLVHYVVLGVAGCLALLWTLLSMGAIKLRDHSMYTEREKHIEAARHAIEETFHIIEQIPAVNRDNIRDFLDKGEFFRARDEARLHNDVYHFFKNY